MKPWIGRRQKIGMYDQLMVELRKGDYSSFTNFLCMLPTMFDKLLVRVHPRITKNLTFYRSPLEPGMNLTMTLRHLASGNKYASMNFGWRVPNTTQSLVVREVCQAIIDEYMDEVLVCPSIPDGWRTIAENVPKMDLYPTCGT